MSAPPTYFISGVQRSGTTLLSFLLSGHSQIDMQPRATAFRLITCFKNYRERLGDTITDDQNERFRQLIRQDYKGILAELLDWENFDQYESIQELIATSIEQQLATKNKTIWVDKAPNLQHYLEGLFYLMPNAKIIHIIRDGRAVANSMHRRTNKPLRLCAQEWVDGNVEALAAQRLLGRDKIYFLSYEDLVKDATATLKGVCQFLDIGFEPQMLDLEAHQQTGGDTAYVDTRFDSQKLTAYQNQLTAKQLQQIETIQLPLLQQFDYPLLASPTAYQPLTTAQQIWLRQQHNFSALFRA
ncbi:MAG: sulfotransferase [Bacteroidota bacterium]